MKAGTNPSQTLDPNPAQSIRRGLGLDGVGIARTQKPNTEYTEIDEGHAISARAERTHANHIQTQQQQSAPPPGANYFHRLDIYW